jgi:hypothetical protein
VSRFIYRWSRGGSGDDVGSGHGGVNDIVGGSGLERWPTVVAVWRMGGGDGWLLGGRGGAI